MDEYSPFLRRVALVANRKGGVLKSSIVRSVAAELVRAGYKVAVVDGDPQGNLSKIDFGLGGVEVGGWEADRGRSLAMALQFGTDLTPIQAHGVDVVCGGPELLGSLGAAAANPETNLAGNLRRALARLCSERRYDLVLFDSGPGDTKLLDAYMVASKWLIVPVVDGDEASFDGLDKMGARYADLARRDADLEFLGAVLTLVDHKAPARNKRVREELSEALGEAGEPFEAMIRDSKAARSDTRMYGLSAVEVAEKAVEVQRRRLAALRRRRAEAKGKHRATSTLETPEGPWATRDGSGLAEDYRLLSKEIVTRIGERLAAQVA